MKVVSISDFLTTEELEAAVKIYKERPQTLHFHARCRDEIIKPVIDRINRDLGQENDPAYLAYMVEHVLNELK